MPSNPSTQGTQSISHGPELACDCGCNGDPVLKAKIAAEKEAATALKSKEVAHGPELACDCGCNGDPVLKAKIAAEKEAATALKSKEVAHGPELACDCGCNGDPVLKAKIAADAVKYLERIAARGPPNTPDPNEPKPKL